MSPHFYYTLTEDACSRYDSILAAQGIRFEAKSRNTFELLDGSLPTICIHGCLCHEDKEFPFTIQKSANGHHLKVEPLQHGQAHAERFMEALERAFPQPERGILHRPKPERGWELGPVIVSVACLGCLTLVAATCFFAVVGIRSWLR